MRQILKRLLSRLRVEPGEYMLVALLLLHSFCIGVTVVFFETAAYSIFLTRYEGAAGILPLVYMIASGTTIGVGMIFAGVERRVSFQRYLALLLLTVLAALAGLRLLFAVTTDPFPALLAVIAFDVLWVLQSLEFWGLAGRIFNVRQGKRLFGLIGSGEVVAMVLGGAVVPLLLRFLPAINLYFLAGAGVVLSLLMLLIISRQYLAAAPADDDRDRGATAPAAENRPDERPLRQLLRERYLLLIVGLAAVTIFTLYFTDNAYFASAGERYPDPEALAAFMGVFLSLAGLAQLFVRALLTGWLLSRFGVLVGLLLLPVSLALSSAAAIGAQALGAAAGVVFALVMLVKLLDRSLRYSLNRAAALILYQPLSPQERLRTQTLVESVIEPLAGISSGAVLLLLNQLLRPDAIQLLFIMLFVIVLWLVLVVLLNREYTAALVQALNRRRIGGVTLALNDSSSLAVLRRTLQSDRPGEVIYALNMLETVNHDGLETFLRDLLTHPSPAVRRTVLEKIEKRRSAALRPAVAARLEQETLPDIQSQMLRTLCALGAPEQVLPYLQHPQPALQAGAMIGLLRGDDVTGFLAAQTRLLAAVAAPQPAERRFAATILGEVHSSTLSAEAPLTKLLSDPEPEVRQAAALAAGRVRLPALYPLMVTYLETTGNGLSAAMQALAAAGEGILPLLIDTFTKPEQPRHVLLRLLRVMSAIGGDQVKTWLHSQRACPDEFVRYYILEALLKLGYRATPAEYAELEFTIGRETREIAWNLTVLLEARTETRATLLVRALEQEIDLTLQRIIMLLALRYESAALLTVQANYNHPSREKRAYALEILDTTLSRELKTTIMPLIEMQEPQQRWHFLSSLYPQQSQPLMQRLRGILVGDYQEVHPWTKACVFYTIAELGDKQASPDVAAVLFGTTDIIVRETALWTLYRLNPVLYNIYQRSLQDIQKGEGKSALAKSTIVAAATIEKEIRGQGKMLLLVEKVIILRTVSIFAEMPEDYLAEIAMVLQEVLVAPGETFIRKGDPGNCLYIIASGRVRVHDGEREFVRLGEREVVGELALLDSEPRNADVSAVEETMLLKLEQDIFFELIASNPPVVRGVMRVLTRRLRASMARN
ncbi:MAG: cyclic nucleotide-binding domain-containing protein [Anaerolineae bacterium]|nr:cyclic nucleotide-binding domain-containing protein [Anaerolineae bacterium]